MKDAALPVVLIVLGIAWLLNSLDWLPEIHWLWILGLAGAGGDNNRDFWKGFVH